MKDNLNGIKFGVLAGMSFLFTIIIGGSIFAIVNNNWTNPNSLEANSGSVLTSENRNAILSNQNVLSGALLGALSYSTGELATGETWIDGRSIYRKVLTFTSPSTMNTRIEISHGINGLYKVIDLHGMLYFDNWGFPLPYVWIVNSSVQDLMGIGWNGNTISFTTRDNINSLDKPGFIVITYTK